MAPVDIRPKGYQQPPLSFVIPPESGIKNRRRLAEILAQQGLSTEPVEHWTQAAARVGNSLASVLGNYQANQMEQQRTSALGQALMSGATPEQLFATGDEQLMNIAKFKLQQQQQQIEADRQAEMLRLAQAQNTREEAKAAAPPPTASAGEGIWDPVTQTYRVPIPAAPRYVPPTPGEAERQRQDVRTEVAGAENVKAAKLFLSKVARQKAELGDWIDTGQKDANGEPIREFKPKGDSDSMFGPIEGSPYYRGVGALFNTDTERRRSGFETNMDDLALDYARATMKGQGQVGQGERKIARDVFPSVGRDQDARSAWETLNDRERDAQAIIDSNEGGAARVPPPQHPVQNAPPPRPNVNAGQVPHPSASAPQSEFSYDSYEDIPDNVLYRDESDGKLYRNRNGQRIPQ